MVTDLILNEHIDDRGKILQFLGHMTRNEEQTFRVVIFENIQDSFQYPNGVIIHEILDIEGQIKSVHG
jgi:hypothetical protein